MSAELHTSHQWRLRVLGGTSGLLALGGLLTERGDFASPSGAKLPH